MRIEAAPNVILVVIDTLRADRLQAYGTRQPLTPLLDELAAQGVVFEHAYAQSSWTNASVGSLLTSRFVTQHGVTSFAARLPETETTLPELLRAAGYRTVRVSANALLGVKLQAVRAALCGGPARPAAERQPMKNAFSLLPSRSRK